MAYLTQNDEEEQKRTAGSTGGGAFTSGGGSPAAQGSGGIKQFANIQNYLSANEGVSSAPQFEKEVGSALKTEQEGLNKSLSDYNTQLSGAGSAAESQLQSGKNALQAAKDYYKSHDPLTYDYSAGQAPSSELSQKLQPVQSAFNLQFQSPSYGGYRTGEKYQDYSAGLKLPESTTQYYDFLNKTRGAGNMTTGQKALQNQLDVADTKLPQIRAALANQYSDFQKSIEPKQQEALQTGRNVSEQLSQKTQDLRNQYNQFEKNRQGYESALNEKKYDNTMQVNTNPGYGIYSLKDLNQFYGDANPYSKIAYGAQKNSEFNNILNALRGQYGI